MTKQAATRPPWSLEARGGHLYVLHNDGDAAVYDVRVSLPESMKVHGFSYVAPSLGPRESIQFGASPSFTDSFDDQKITVTWRDATGGRTWTCPFT